MAARKKKKPRKESAGKAKRSKNSGKPARSKQRRRDPKGTQPPFPVVGIGASAGGLDAFKRFFSAMPADSGMAFVLVPHLDPTHRSLMVELLAKQTTMSVVEAEDDMPIRPDCVYIIPPNRYLSIERRRLRLSEPPKPRGLQTAIDAFFRSLARDRTESAIGVVLSGTGSHGTLGLKEIKLAGGMVMVQDPETAEYDQMPRSAIGTGMADFILPPERMPEALVKYARHDYLNHLKPGAPPKEAPEQLNRILAVLRARTEYDFRYYRKNMLMRRVQRRMGLCQINEIDDYVAHLRENAEEVTALYRDLLIGVTGFFREPEAFEVLQQRVIPEMVERQGGEIPVRVWVPGCATGEEAYSIAVLILEQFAAHDKAPNLQVFATDIDERSLETGRQGIYPESIAGDVTADRLKRFFVKTDEHHYQINKQLRESVVFAVQNVISDAPFSKLDLVSCRNLLIYLEPEIQEKIVSLFHFALNEQGYLLLGPSESVGRQSDLFEPVSKKWRVYRRIGPTRHDRIEIPIVAAEERRLHVPAAEPALRPAMGFAELTQKMLLAEYAPAAVLVNRNYEILYFFGPTINYLELPTGEPTKDLMAMVRQGLRTRVRAACHKALRDKETVTESDARVLREGSYVPCTVAARPVAEPREAEGLLLITFRDRETALAAPDGRGAENAEEAEASLVQQLEYELKATREDLQSTIEELESSNEEMKASNEEVMSMNEELQSTNEELETSKEELQSLNEELSTVNNQLQDKVAELEQLNNDVTNLLNSTDIATVFLDTDLRIRRFTPATAELLSLIASDVGRPIRDFAPRFTDDELLEDCREVLEKLSPIEVEVHTEDGRCFLRRVLPYRTADNHIEGVVITFVDVTEGKQREREIRKLSEELEERVQQRTRELNSVNDELRRERDRAQHYLDVVGVMVVALDQQGQVTLVNPRACEILGLSENEIFGSDWFDRFLPEHCRSDVRRVFDKILQGGIAEVEHFENLVLTAEGQERLIRWHNSELLCEEGRVVGVLSSGTDITDRRRAEEALRESEERLRSIVDTAADAIITIDEQGTIESFNPAAEQMFGYSADEAVGQNVKILMPPPFRDEHDDYIRRFLQTGQRRMIGIGREVLGRRKVGTVFPVDLSVSEMHDGGQRLFTGIVRDISERKAMQNELLTIATEEQRRIGQDLHDQAGQELTGLSLLAGSLAETLQEHSPENAEAANRLAAGIEHALNQIRSLSRWLIPVEVDAEGLMAALQELAERTSRDSGVRCEFRCETSVPIDDNETATHLYRIAQEAVTNALKHGKPRRVEISLESHVNQGTLSVRDDGTGIAEAGQQIDGMGLQIMRYRAALIGGTLTVAPVEGGGTLVSCTFLTDRRHGHSRSHEDRRSSVEG